MKSWVTAALVERRDRIAAAAEVGTPYVLRGLIAQLSDPMSPRFGEQISHSFDPPSEKVALRDAAKSLAKAFLDEEHCPGAHGLSEADSRPDGQVEQKQAGLTNRRQPFEFLWRV